MNKERVEAIKFFQENAGWCTPPGKMVCARDYADDEAEAKTLGIEWAWEDDDIPWDGDPEVGPTPKFVMGCVAVHPAIDRYDVALWGIGFLKDPMIGYKGLEDPYVHVIQAELARDAIEAVKAWLRNSYEG